MNVISTVKDIRTLLLTYKQKQRTIAFVPTMGKLHDGHLSLIREAKKRADIVVVSIFVNPTQFGPNEDYNQYPRDLNTDLKHCLSLKVDVVFTPSASDLYGKATHPTEIYIPTLSQLHCGQSRKTFFKGICSVVLRFFMIIQPDIAIFGEKDYQQFILLSQMVTDLFLPITMISAPIYREKNGLAMSSRNTYLSKSQLQEAAEIYTALTNAKQLFQQGETSSNVLVEQITQHIQSNTSIRIDYCVGIDYQLLTSKNHLKRNDRILFAGYLNKTRLIDNISLV